MSGYIKMFYIDKRREMYFGKGMRADDVLVSRATWKKNYVWFFVNRDLNVSPDTDNSFVLLLLHSLVRGLL